MYIVMTAAPLGSDPSPIQKEGGHTLISGPGDFTYTQDFISVSSKTATIAATYGGVVTHVVLTLLGALSQAAPTINIFQAAKIDKVELAVHYCGTDILLQGNKPGSGIYLMLAPYSRSQRTSTTGYQTIPVGALPGCEVKYIQSWSTTSTGYDAGGNQPQMVKATNCNPMYQLATYSENSLTSVGQSFSSSPLGIQTARGNDDTEWNAFILDVATFQPAINTTSVYLKYIFKTTITFSGLKWDYSNWTLSSPHLVDRRCQSTPLILGKDGNPAILPDESEEEPSEEHQDY